MKRISMHDIRCFLETPKDEIELFREKAPFPGQFPTRVYLRVGGYQLLNECGRRFEYLGKPCYLATQNFTRNFRANAYDYASIEFDRGGPIAMDIRTPRERTWAFNERVWEKYHPHQGWDTRLSWMNYKFKLGKSGWYVVGNVGREA